MNGRRPRVLYLIAAYPTFSETYMHEEIRSLIGECDVKIITYRDNLLTEARRDAFPYQAIPYLPDFGQCLVYGQIEKIDREFSSPEQRAFLSAVEAVIEEFEPDVMHAHYLGMGVLLGKLAEIHHIPFTIRTHSMDVLSEPRRKLEAFCESISSPWCLRVLAFPANCQRLTSHGFDPGKIEPCWPVINFERFHRPEARPPTRQVLCAGPAIRKKAHGDFIELAANMRGSGHGFHLYAAGPTLKSTRIINASKGNVVNITYADPDDMPQVYPRHDWLVYTSDPRINKVGLPVAIPEAQAAGLGVCWQELPGRRDEQLEFLGGGGFLFRSINDVPAILQEPYPEHMRQAGFRAARRCDIESHKSLLTDVWYRALADRARRQTG